MNFAKRLSLAIGAWLLWGCAAHSDDELAGRLSSRLHEFGARIAPAPVATSAIFSAAFMNRTSSSQLDASFTDLFVQVGRCAPLASSPGDQPTALNAIFQCDDGYLLVELRIQAHDPHLIEAFSVRQSRGDLSPGKNSL